MGFSVLWIGVLLVTVVSLNGVQATWEPSFTPQWELKGPPPQNETCLLLSGRFQVIVPYLMTNGEIGQATIDIPKHSKESGTCESATWLQEIQLNWPVPKSNDSMTNALMLTFSQNGSRTNPVITGYFQLVAVKLNLHSNDVDFPNDTNTGRVITLHANNLGRWNSPLEMSYYCESPEQIPLDLGGGAYMNVHHVQAQPFHVTPVEGNPSDFGFRSYCGADISSMMSNGLLFIGLLFSISIVIAFFLQRQSKRNHYRPI